MVRRTYLPYVRMLHQPLDLDTAMVLLHLVAVRTRPVSVRSPSRRCRVLRLRLGHRALPLAAAAASPPARSSARAMLRRTLAELIGLRRLARGARHAQVELLAPQLQQLSRRRSAGGLPRSSLASHPAHLAFHERWWKPTASRAARRNASRAMSSVTPSISNNTLPGCTRATVVLDVALPLPMRTSSGFLRDRHIRKHAHPDLAAALRRSATWRGAPPRSRAPSCGRGSVAFRPNSPNATVLPRCAQAADCVP